MPLAGPEVKNKKKIIIIIIIMIIVMIIIIIATTLKYKRIIKNNTLVPGSVWNYSSSNEK